MFVPAERELPHLRLNRCVHPPDTIKEGVRRLGRALTRLDARELRRKCPASPSRMTVVV